MSVVKMYYFGPWDAPGHFLHDNKGYILYRGEKSIPWTLGQLDGGLQPHTCGRPERGERCYRGTCAAQGLAIIHHKDGWTALAFWDSSVDTRSGCTSVYIAQGDFNFAEMVTMTKERFAIRWNKMIFKVSEMPHDEPPA